jgi:hypothetical protein
MDAGQVAGSCPRSHRHDVVLQPVHVLATCGQSGG